MALHNISPSLSAKKNQKHVIQTTRSWLHNDTHYGDVTPFQIFISSANSADIYRAVIPSSAGMMVVRYHLWILVRPRPFEEQTEDIQQLVKHGRVSSCQLVQDLPATCLPLAGLLDHA